MKRLIPLILALLMTGISPVILLAGTIEYAQEKVLKDSNNPYKHFKLGVAYQYGISRHQEAIASFKEAIRLKPDYAEAYFKIGTIYHWQGQYQEAIAPLKEAIRINPSNADFQASLQSAYHSRSLSLLIQGSEQNIIVSLKETIRLDPDDAYSHYYLGYNYSQLGQHQEAILSFKEAIRIKPDYSDAHTQLGFSYGGLGRNQEAIAPLNEAIELNPNDFFAHTLLGWSYNNLGQYQEAIAPLNEAIRIKPDYSYAHTQLGFSYHSLGRNQEAIASLKEALRINPDNTYARDYLEIAEQKQGGKIGKMVEREADERSKSKELETAQELVRQNPNDAKEHYVLGTIFMDLDRYQEAIVSFKEAIRIRPDIFPAYFKLGLAYERLGQYQEAIVPLEEAIRIKPDYFKSHGLLGFAYEKLGQYQEAIASYKEVLKINPKNASVRSRLNLIEQKLAKEADGKQEQNTHEALQNKKEADRLARERKLLEEERKKWEASRLAEENRRQQPSKEKSRQSGTGSGFFISKMGHVITNAHVVEDCKKVTVGDNANKQVPAKVIRADRRNDLALLKLSTLEMASADSKSFIQKLGNVMIPLATNGLLRSEDVRRGERLLVAGYPFGDFISNTMKVTTGIVSATVGVGDDSGQFQLDAAIQPGNSGGPIYDYSGNIVGVVVSQLNKMKMAEDIGTIPENQNFGIKASTVRQFLESSGFPSKKAEGIKNKSTEEVAQIAENQALMVMCFQ
jgi:tetratricopeptide (TPR) repeat protein